jgi:hypothetical protein
MLPPSSGLVHRRENLKSRITVRYDFLVYLLNPISKMSVHSISGSHSYIEDTSYLISKSL